MKAALFHGPHQPLTIETVSIANPGPREVLIRTAAVGLCHSDLHYIDGLYAFDAPAILGHEAAGIVEKVGSEVTGLKAGDFVHTLGDAHLYSNHLEQARLQLTRLPRALPVMTINPAVKDIFAFKNDDFKLEGYDPLPHIKAEVAV